MRVTNICFLWSFQDQDIGRFAFFECLCPWLTDSIFSLSTKGLPQACVLISSSYKGIYHIGLGPNHMISFYLTSLRTLSPNSHILSRWGLGFQHMNTKGTQFSPKQLYSILREYYQPTCSISVILNALGPLPPHPSATCLLLPYGVVNISTGHLVVQGGRNSKSFYCLLT